MNGVIIRLSVVAMLTLVISACNPEQQAEPYMYDDNIAYDRNLTNDMDSYDHFENRDAGTYSTYDTNDGRGIADRVPAGDELDTYNQAIPYGARDTPLDSNDHLAPGLDRDRDHQAGAQNRQRSEEQQQQGNIRQAQEGNNGERNHMRAPQSPNEEASAEEVARRLVELATKVDEVNDATAVVVGRYAVVGIDVDAKLDRSKVGSIKYSVAEALKADPKGAYAIVTADVDTNYRLREMAKDIREGKPVAGIMEELAGIVGRLIPQVPRVVEEPQDEETTPNDPEQQGE